jgi:hypothetical protein
MREPRIASFTRHADQRLAQRNLSLDDVGYVCAHGRVFHAAHAIFVHLGRRDIPEEHQRISRFRRLEGTVLVLDPYTGQHLTTAYRNRQRGFRDIKRKRKRFYGSPAPDC